MVEQNLTLLMKHECTKAYVRLLPWAVLTMNCQRTSSIGVTPNELFHGGGLAWFFQNSFPGDYKSPKTM